MFRRETLIALRARHEAYRIATDIQYPPAEVERPQGPPQPVIPQMFLDTSERISPRRQPSLRDLTALGVVIGLIVLTYWVCWCFSPH